LQERNQARFT